MYETVRDLVTYERAAGIYAVGAGIEDPFRGPEFVDGRAGDGDGGQAACGENDVAESLERDGEMLHLDPEKIESEACDVGGELNGLDLALRTCPPLSGASKRGAMVG